MPNPSAVDLTKLPKLAAADLRLLWVNDFYDGPLEAVVERAGERLLMVLHGDPFASADAPMEWVLYALTPAQWSEEERWHALFEEHVGHHWCFHHDPVPDPLAPREPQRFYDAYRERTPIDLAEGRAVAWVDEIPTR